MSRPMARERSLRTMASASPVMTRVVFDQSFGLATMARRDSEYWPNTQTRAPRGICRCARMQSAGFTSSVDSSASGRRDAPSCGAPLTFERRTKVNGAGGGASNCGSRDEVRWHGRHQPASEDTMASSQSRSGTASRRNAPAQRDDDGRRERDAVEIGATSMGRLKALLIREISKVYATHSVPVNGVMSGADWLASDRRALPAGRRLALHRQAP